MVAIDAGGVAVLARRNDCQRIAIQADRQPVPKSISSFSIGSLEVADRVEHDISRTDLRGICASAQVAGLNHVQRIHPVVQVNRDISGN